MADCLNTEIRELLPEHVHGLLSEADALAIEQHLVACAACAQELALLHVVKSVRPRAVPVNVSHIVAQLPRPGQASAVKSRVLSIESTARKEQRVSAPSMTQRSRRFYGTWRIAATITLIAGGGLSLAVARRGLNSFQSTTPLTDTVMAVNISPTSPNVGRTDSMIGKQSKGAALSVGELSDYSDDELESVIKKLEKWDGAAAADPLPGVPLVSSSGASQ